MENCTLGEDGVPGVGRGLSGSEVAREDKCTEVVRLCHFPLIGEAVTSVKLAALSMNEPVDAECA